MTKCQWPLRECDQPIWKKSKMAFCEKHIEEWEEMNRKELQDFIKRVRFES